MASLEESDEECLDDPIQLLDFEQKRFSGCQNISAKASLEESDEECLDDPIQLLDFEQKRFSGCQNLCNSSATETVFDVIDSDGDLYIEKSKAVQKNIIPRFERFPRFKQTVITLPVTFFDIPQNVNLLNSCQPVYVKLINCKEHPWYFKKYLKNDVNGSYADEEVDFFIRKNKKSLAKSCKDVNMLEEAKTVKIRPVSSPYDNLKVSSPKSLSLKKKQDGSRKEDSKEKDATKKASNQENPSQVDFKKNQGLIGMKITQTIDTNATVTKTTANAKHRSKSSKNKHKTLTDEKFTNVDDKKSKSMKINNEIHKKITKEDPITIINKHTTATNTNSKTRADNDAPVTTTNVRVDTNSRILQDVNIKENIVKTNSKQADKRNEVQNKSDRKSCHVLPKGVPPKMSECKKLAKKIDSGADVVQSAFFSECVKTAAIINTKEVSKLDIEKILKNDDVIKTPIKVTDKQVSSCPNVTHPLLVHNEKKISEQKLSEQNDVSKRPCTKTKKAVKEKNKKAANVVQKKGIIDMKTKLKNKILLNFSVDQNSPAEQKNDIQINVLQSKYATMLAKDIIESKEINSNNNINKTPVQKPVTSNYQLKPGVLYVENSKNTNNNVLENCDPTVGKSQPSWFYVNKLKNITQSMPTPQQTSTSVNNQAAILKGYSQPELEKPSMKKVPENPVCTSYTAMKANMVKKAIKTVIKSATETTSKTQSLTMTANQATSNNGPFGKSNSQNINVYAGYNNLQMPMAVNVSTSLASTQPPKDNFWNKSQPVAMDLNAGLINTQISRDNSAVKSQATKKYPYLIASLNKSSSQIKNTNRKIMGILKRKSDVSQNQFHTNAQNIVYSQKNNCPQQNITSIAQSEKPVIINNGKPLTSVSYNQSEQKTNNIQARSLNTLIDKRDHILKPVASQQNHVGSHPQLFSHFYTAAQIPRQPQQQLPNQHAVASQNLQLIRGGYDMERQQPQLNGQETVWPPNGVSKSNIYPNIHLQKTDLGYQSLQQTIPPTCDIAPGKNSTLHPPPKITHKDNNIQNIDMFQFLHPPPNLSTNMNTEIPSKNASLNPVPCRQQMTGNLNAKTPMHENPHKISRYRNLRQIPRHEIPQNNFQTNFENHLQHNLPPYGHGFQEQSILTNYGINNLQNYVNSAPVYNCFPQNNTLVNQPSYETQGSWSVYYPSIVPPPAPPPPYHMPVQPSTQNSNPATVQAYSTPTQQSVAGPTIIGCNGTGPVRKINILGDSYQPVYQKTNDVTRTRLEVSTQPLNLPETTLKDGSTLNSKKEETQATSENKNEHVARLSVNNNKECTETNKSSHKSVIVNTKKEMLKELTKITTMSSLLQSPKKRPSATTCSVPENVTLPDAIMRPRPGPLSKKPKLNTAVETPQNKAQSSLVAHKGYSPPILPIPSYQKTLEILAKSNMADPKLLYRSEDERQPDLFNSESIESNRTNVSTSGENIEKVKKISLDEYKKRDPKTDDINGGELLVNKIKIEIKSENPDQDLGYDSDSTVKV